MKLYSYEIRTKKSFLRSFAHQFLQRLLWKPSDHRKESVSLYEFPRGHEHLRLFTFIPLFVSFFLFFFLILLYRCRARARKKMKNARFLLHSVCDRFLFRTSNVPLSFFLYNNQNTRGTMIVVSLYHVHAYTVY